MNPDWLDLAAGMLGASPAFRKAMDEQLASEALTRAGIQVRRGFAVLPAEEPLSPRYSGKGIGSIEVDLVGPDAWGERAVIAWADSRGGGPVKPEDSDASLAARDLRFWWHEFPEDALRARYTDAAGERATTAAPDLPFPVSKEPLAWPDVWFEIRTEQPATPRGIERLVEHLEARRAAWNATGDGGLIHNFREPRPLEDRRLEMHVDFGTAAETVLDHWLQALAEAPIGTPITEVHLRGFSELDTPRAAG